MELPARVEYALIALMEMANCHVHQEPLKIGEITARQPIPDRYLEQILMYLRRGGIVQSQRGAKGGYVLMRAPWQITVFEVFASIEGEPKRKESSELLTPEQNLIYEIWQQARASAQMVLRQYTLQDLCQRREEALSDHPMYYI